MSRAARIGVVLALTCGGCAQDVAEEAPVLDVDLSAVAGDDATLPHLQEPFSEAETRALREGFDWSATSALPETDPDGHASLYYFVVYLHGSEESAQLRYLGGHHSLLPLFASERARYVGATGKFGWTGDRAGVFAFTILPGAIYNRFRDAALAGNPLYVAIIPRAVPEPSALNSDGSLDYRWLVENGFTYEAGRTAMPLASGGARAPLFGFLSDAINAVGEFAQGVVDTVREGIATIDGALSGTAQIRVVPHLLNTDRAFDATEPLRQTWGTAIGSEVVLRGVPVYATAGAIGLRIAETDDIGGANIVVPKGEVDLCIHTKNQAGYVTDAGLFEAWICTFAGTSATAAGRVIVSRGAGESDLRVTRPTTISLKVRDWYTNVLGQFQDGRDYFQSVAGVRITAVPKVVVGPVGDLLGSLGGPAFVPCVGLRGHTTTLDPALAPIDEVSQLLIALVGFGADAVFNQQAGRSRGIPSHEFGHWAMCWMMYDEDPQAAATAWADVIGEALLAGDSPGSDSVVLNEGFADFIAGQLAGGVNYFQTVGAGTADGNMWFCDPAATSCLEDNIGGGGGGLYPPATIVTGGNRPRLARWTTLLHDAFDGQPPGNFPTNGAAWARQFVDTDADGVLDPDEAAGDSDGDGLSGIFDSDSDNNGVLDGMEPGAIVRPNPLTGPRSANTRGDEPVALPGRALRSLVRNWSRRANTLEEGPMLGALADTMRGEGVSDADICTVFALHSPTGMCDGLGSAVTGRGTTPARVLGLAGTVDAANSATWTWMDVSARATGSSFGVTCDVSGAAGTLQVLPYARASTSRPITLPFDERCTATVQTLNGLVPSAPASSSLVSYAEVASDLVATPLAGGARLTWSRARASTFDVRVYDPASGALVETVVSTSTEAVLSGLAPHPYELAVVSRNRAGTPSAESARVRVTPLVPRSLYVSARSGDDAFPTPGTPALPFRTIGAALAVAAAGGADELLLDIGTYSEPRLTVPTGASVAIRGGFDSTSAWRFYGEQSVVDLTAPAVATGGSLVGVAAGFAGRAPAVGLRVDRDARLTVENVDLRARAVAPTGSNCTVAVQTAGGAIDFANSAISVVGSPSAGECRVGVVALRDGSEPSIRATRGTTITGMAAGAATSAPRDVLVAGVLVGSASDVTITDSIVVGIAGATLSAPTGTLLLYGATLAGARAIRVSRSTVHGSQASASFLPIAGRVVGLHADALTSLFIDNSVIDSPTGAAENRALEIGSSGSVNASVRIYFATIVAGGDWGLDHASPTPFIGSAMSINGNVQDLRLINSLLVYAAGGGDRAGVVTSTLDRTGTTQDPSELVIRGNIASHPLLWTNAFQSLAHCQPVSEFYSIRDEPGLNEAGRYACGIGTSTVTWVASDNAALVTLPGTPAAARPGAVTLDVDGNPLPARASTTFVLGAGVEVESAMASDVGSTRQGRARAIGMAGELTSGGGVGAY